MKRGLQKTAQKQRESLREFFQPVWKQAREKKSLLKLEFGLDSALSVQSKKT